MLPVILFRISSTATSTIVVLVVGIACGGERVGLGEPAAEVDRAAAITAKGQSARIGFAKTLFARRTAQRGITHFLSPPEDFVPLVPLPDELLLLEAPLLLLPDEPLDLELLSDELLLVEELEEDLSASAFFLYESLR